MPLQRLTPAASAAIGFTARAEDPAPTGLYYHPPHAPLPPPSREPNIFNATQEYDLGDAVAERFESRLRIFDDEALTATLRRIGSRLVAHLPPTELEIQFHFVDVPDANAFVLPGRGIDDEPHRNPAGPGQANATRAFARRFRRCGSARSC